MRVGDIVETKFPMVMRDQTLGMGHMGRIVREYLPQTENIVRVWLVKFWGKPEAVTIREDEIRVIQNWSRYGKEER
jgi:hypothetical protein